MLWPHLWSYHSLNDGNLWLESQQPSSILICTSEMGGINASLCRSLSPSIHICLCRTRLPVPGRAWAGVGRSHVSDRQLVSVSTVVLILRVRTRSKMSYHRVCVCVCDMGKGLSACFSCTCRKDIFQTFLADHFFTPQHLCSTARWFD